MGLMEVTHYRLRWTRTLLATRVLWSGRCAIAPGVELVRILEGHTHLAPGGSVRFIAEYQTPSGLVHFDASSRSKLRGFNPCPQEVGAA